MAVGAAAFTFATLFSHNSTYAQTRGNPDVTTPANDDFASAEPIQGPTGFVVGNNTDASVEPGEPLVYKGGESVWYRWTSPGDVSITFDLKPMNDAFVGISIYDGLIVEKLAPMGHGLHFDRVTFIAQRKGEYSIQISSKSANLAGDFELSWAINGAETWKQFNFDGPLASAAGPPVGKSDFAIHRWWSLSKDTSQWWIWRGNTADPIVYNFGDHFIAPEHLAPGDYDGDGLVDIGFFHKQGGEFWIYRSSTNTALVQSWGLTGDNPVQGDFDGDDMADFAIWRPSTGTFWVLNSSDGRPYAMQWGMNGDHPVVGDYDGDGITDFAIRRGSGSDPAVFYVLRSSDWQVQIAYFGFGKDMTVPGDYDGDGKNDVAVFRPDNTTFYFLASTTGEAHTVALPMSAPFDNSDRAVPGDYFGDARSDICVWLFRVGDFKCFADGGAGPVTTFHFGLQGDEPVAFSNVH